MSFAAPLMSNIVAALVAIPLSLILIYFQPSLSPSNAVTIAYIASALLLFPFFLVIFWKTGDEPVFLAGEGVQQAQTMTARRVAPKMRNITRNYSIAELSQDPETAKSLALLRERLANKA